MRLAIALLLLFATEPWDSTALTTPYRADLPEGEKLAGVALLWAEARFNFANFDLVPGLDWDAKLVEYQMKARATRSTFAYYRVLQEMAALLHDGHTGVTMPKELADEATARPALEPRLVEGRVIVVDVFDDKLGIEPGAEIVAIDGVPVHDYAATRVRPFVGASTPQDRDVRTYDYFLLSGSTKNPVRLKLADGTERSTPRLPSVDRTTRRPVFALRMLPDNIAYVALNTFGDKSVADQFLGHWDEIAKTDGLIFDVRENGGGNSGYAWTILATLTDKPFLSAQWRTRDYRPAWRAWKRDDDAWFRAPASEHAPDGTRAYNKPVVVLTSARTYSAAEDFAMTFDAMKRGTIVGQPTGGSTGQPLSFKLPGGGSARVCTKRDAYPDGTEFVGVGVQPQVVVAETAGDIRARRDRALEEAVDIIRRRNAALFPR